MITAAIALGGTRPGLPAGDAIGANLTMLRLVLGLAVLARSLPFGGRVRGYAIWSALAGGRPGGQPGSEERVAGAPGRDALEQVRKPDSARSWVSRSANLSR